MITALPTRTHQRMLSGGSGTPNHWLRDGWNMARQEGDGALTSIDTKHAAEVASHEVVTQSLKARGRVALEQRLQLDHSLAKAGFDPAQHLKDLAQGKVDLAWAIGLSILNAALVVFVLLAFGPTGLTLLLALTVLASTVAVEEFFNAYDEKAAFREGVFLALTVLALAAQFWLGTLRGMFLTAGAPEAVGPVTAALRAAAPVLKVSLGILALVAEALAGYKWYRVRVQLYSATARATRERDNVNQELVALHEAIHAAEREPEVRRAYRQIGARQYLAAQVNAAALAEHNHFKRAAIGAAIALVIVTALALFFFTPSASADERPLGRVIILLDRTKSVTADSFRQNIEAVGPVLTRTPAGHRVVVASITDSFGRPEILLDRTLPVTAGYWGFELRAAKEQLVAEWQRIATKLTPVYGRTDLIGSLTLLNYLGDGTDVDTWLVVFSDLRQSSGQLDFEKLAIIPVNRALERLKKATAIPQLARTRVFLVGVEPTGKSAEYFASLKEFWLRFFAEASAMVEAFTITRHVPPFAPTTGPQQPDHSSQSGR